MAHRLQAKPRAPTTQTFYTKGELNTEITAGRFSSHMAEPGGAATLLERNAGEVPVRTGMLSSSQPYQRGFYANRSDGFLHNTENPQSLAEVRRIQARQYVNQARVQSALASNTVNKDEFKNIKETDNKSATPIPENWFYITKSQPVVKDPTRSLYDPSQDCPEWFQIKNKPLYKESDISKAPNFDGTLTMLSRISGWITVTPRNKNRAKRLGRYGPFDKSKKGHNLRNVSDLAPHWMQTDSEKPPPVPYKKEIGNHCMRNQAKLTYMLDKNQPQKSAFAIGDFRHNVMTTEEAQKYMKGLSADRKNLYEWQAEPNRTKDRPVTGKIGSLLMQ